MNLKVSLVTLAHVHLSLTGAQEAGTHVSCQPGYAPSILQVNNSHTRDVYKGRVNFENISEERNI